MIGIRRQMSPFELLSGIEVHGEGNWDNITDRLEPEDRYDNPLEVADFYNKVEVLYRWVLQIAQQQSVL